MKSSRHSFFYILRREKENKDFGLGLERRLVFAVKLRQTEKIWSKFFGPMCGKIAG
jgi:hypothetical protein